MNLCSVYILASTIVANNALTITIAPSFLSKTTTTRRSRAANNVLRTSSINRITSKRLALAPLFAINDDNNDSIPRQETKEDAEEGERNNEDNNISSEKKLFNSVTAMGGTLFRKMTSSIPGMVQGMITSAILPDKREGGSETYETVEEFDFDLAKDIEEALQLANELDLVGDEPLADSNKKEQSGAETYQALKDLDSNLANDVEEALLLANDLDEAVEVDKQVSVNSGSSSETYRKVNEIDPNLAKDIQEAFKLASKASDDLATAVQQGLGDDDLSISESGGEIEIGDDTTMLDDDNDPSSLGEEIISNDVSFIQEDAESPSIFANSNLRENLKLKHFVLRDDEQGSSSENFLNNVEIRNEQEEEDHESYGSDVDAEMEQPSPLFAESDDGAETILKVAVNTLCIDHDVVGATNEANINEGEGGDDQHPMQQKSDAVNVSDSATALPMKAEMADGEIAQENKHDRNSIHASTAKASGVNHDEVMDATKEVLAENNLEKSEESDSNSSKNLLNDTSIGSNSTEEDGESYNRDVDAEMLQPSSLFAENDNGTETMLKGTVDALDIGNHGVGAPNDAAIYDSQQGDQQQLIQQKNEVFVSDSGADPLMQTKMKTTEGESIHTRVVEAPNANHFVSVGATEEIRTEMSDKSNDRDTHDAMQVKLGQVSAVPDSKDAELIQPKLEEEDVEHTEDTYRRYKKYFQDGLVADSDRINDDSIVANRGGINGNDTAPQQANNTFQQSTSYNTNKEFPPKTFTTDSVLPRVQESSKAVNVDNITATSMNASDDDDDDDIDSGTIAQQASFANNDEKNSGKITMTDSALELAQSLKLDIHEIFQYKKRELSSGYENNGVGEKGTIVMVEDVQEYLDQRYAQLFSMHSTTTENKKDEEMQEHESNRVDPQQPRPLSRRFLESRRRRSDFGSRGMENNSRRSDLLQESKSSSKDFVQNEDWDAFYDNHRKNEDAYGWRNSQFRDNDFNYASKQAHPSQWHQQQMHDRQHRREGLRHYQNNNAVSSSMTGQRDPNYDRYNQRANNGNSWPKVQQPSSIHNRYPLNQDKMPNGRARRHPSMSLSQLVSNPRLQQKERKKSWSSSIEHSPEPSLPVESFYASQHFQQTTQPSFHKQQQGQKQYNADPVYYPTNPLVNGSGDDDSASQRFAFQHGSRSKKFPESYQTRSRSDSDTAASPFRQGEKRSKPTEQHHQSPMDEGI